MVGHRFSPEKADKLLDPKRTKLLNQKEIISLLDLSDHDRIADLGSGNGFFTIPFARKTDNHVFAVDVEPKMLDLLKERALKEGIKNIQYVLSDLENIQLDDASVDKAFVAFVIHEITNMEKALSEFKRILKKDGKLMIIEWDAVESQVGPPIHERISSDKMQSFLLDNGFHSKIVSLNAAVYAAIIEMR
ncbi:class I SAM-dependent methyltransferase [Heyndrickxia oleronia]|uniref:class I SAM-dependent methyltransferase n=1 Tax=Heyndrickxia oleronia TaxID=38875 RepID=UPI001C0EF083|nr:methyltransferase domain-containing protein [Heyndrickxia oleronia]MBU5213971.1 methyltransferase domain-containing protein [Heyndrickxia oleronia]